MCPVGTNEETNGEDEMKTRTQNEKKVATCKGCGDRFDYALMLVDGICHTCRRFGGPKDRVKVVMSDEPLDLEFGA